MTAIDRAILILPPFAEEMNRTRRLVHDTATALGNHGIPSLSCDFYGTGDSAGDFADARWDIWLDDARRAIAWMRDQGARRIGIFAVRLGALAALELSGDCQDLFLLQPQLDGKRAMRQFLRIRLASDMERSQRGVAAGPNAEVLEAMLRAGDSVTIAGYELPGALYQAVIDRPLANCTLGTLAAVHVIGLGAADDDPAAINRHLSLLAGWGAAPQAHILSGPAVWQQLEPAPTHELGAAIAALIDNPACAR